MSLGKSATDFGIFWGGDNEGVFTPHILVPENGRKRGFRDAASGGVQYICKNTPDILETEI